MQAAVFDDLLGTGKDGGERKLRKKINLLIIPLIVIFTVF
jgi:hypothetical protein